MTQEAASSTLILPRSFNCISLKIIFHPWGRILLSRHPSSSPHTKVTSKMSRPSLHISQLLCSPPTNFQRHFKNSLLKFNFQPHSQWKPENSFSLNRNSLFALWRNEKTLSTDQLLVIHPHGRNQLLHQCHLMTTVTCPPPGPPWTQHPSWWQKVLLPPTIS